MRNYVSMSIELHLFFLRIMKEHALFLQAGFMATDTGWIKKAADFYADFERALLETVNMSTGIVGESQLCSQEIVTPFTLSAEKKTSELTGASIDFRITMAERTLKAGCFAEPTREMQHRVRKLNTRVLGLLDGLIAFKESILREVSRCRLFTVNYPLLIKHIIREAKLYRSFLQELETTGNICPQSRREQELFWNRIMMEHALFIRGLLDPSEQKLIETADDFAREYAQLLQETEKQTCAMMQSTLHKTIEETEKYRDFKAAGTEGILNCQIAALILPLLADHVLREANHYLRILRETE